MPGSSSATPAAAGCASGHIGMVGEGQVQVSTSNRNFAGKQGPGDNYLASPTVAAWAALTGEITVVPAGLGRDI
jgi:3-isopropylmalate/(R)-2-methylmalate dehydratase large subunit